jgi:hypothetical protein
VAVETLERFAQNKCIIEEYASRCLAEIDSDLGRLAHVSMLRNVSSGRYCHSALERIYSAAAVHQALQYCHQELFERTLENSLELQEWDLRTYFAEIDAPPDEIAARWLELEFPRAFVPFGTPPYLRDLFLSNISVILKLIVAEHASHRSAA